MAPLVKTISLAEIDPNSRVSSLTFEDYIKIQDAEFEKVFFASTVLGSLNHALADFIALKEVQLTNQEWKA